MGHLVCYRGKKPLSYNEPTKYARYKYNKYFYRPFSSKYRHGRAKRCKKFKVWFESSEQ